MSLIKHKIDTGGNTRPIIRMKFLGKLTNYLTRVFRAEGRCNWMTNPLHGYSRSVELTGKQFPEVSGCENLLDLMGPAAG